jgi:hypothetical protein
LVHQRRRWYDAGPAHPHDIYVNHDVHVNHDHHHVGVRWWRRFRRRGRATADAIVDHDVTYYDNYCGHDDHERGDTRRPGHDDYDATAVASDIDRLGRSYRVGRLPTGQVVLRSRRMLGYRPSNREGGCENP